MIWTQGGLFYKAKALHHTSLRLMASTFPAWICYAIAFFEKEKKILLTEKAFVALFFSYSIFEKRRGSTYDALQVIFTQKNGNRWHCPETSLSIQFLEILIYVRFMSFGQGVECRIFGIVIFFNCGRVLQFGARYTVRKIVLKL